MNPKPTIADAGNVTVPAYLSLLAKGYRVSCTRHPDTAEETWYAENDSIRLVSEDVLALLGLAAVFESSGSDWQASDSQIEDFVRKFEC